MDMEGCEANAFTVLKRLGLRDEIKLTSVRILETIYKPIDNTNKDAVDQKYEEVKFQLNEFKRLKRQYRSGVEATLVDELSKTSNILQGHISDVKEML